MKVFKYILLCLTSCGAMSGYAQNAKNKVVEKILSCQNTGNWRSCGNGAGVSWLVGCFCHRKHAMEHLQPSSFSDILELLPGGRSHDPDLNSPNTIRLREAGSPSGYTTTSLGTSLLWMGHLSVPMLICNLWLEPGTRLPLREKT